MNKSAAGGAAKPAPKLPELTGPLRPPSQYLKISFSSKRRLLLQRLANSLGCSWQSIALEAIDDLLDREQPPKNHV